MRSYKEFLDIFRILVYLGSLMHAAGLCLVQHPDQTRAYYQKHVIGNLIESSQDIWPHEKQTCVWLEKFDKVIERKSRLFA